MATSDQIHQELQSISGKLTGLAPQYNNDNDENFHKQLLTQVMELKLVLIDIRNLYASTISTRSSRDVS